MHRLAYKCLIFTQSPNVLALFTHLSDGMSISRCVQHWQLFAYVKQVPTLFEVLLNRLPYLTTDTLSHSSWRLGIWSCNMNTCIQTQEHSRKYSVMLTLLRYKDQISLCTFDSLMSQRPSEFRRFCLLPSSLYLKLFQDGNLRKEKSTLCYRQQCLSSVLCAHIFSSD